MRSSIVTTRPYLISLTVVLLLLIIFLVIELQTGAFSASREVSSSPEIGQPSTEAVLTVPGNQSISVNSAKAIDGATILNGATIVTPDQVGARVYFGLLATLDLAPNTTVRSEFDQNGKVKATLTQGCVILRAGKGTSGEVITSRGSAGKTNSNEGGPLEVCFPQSAWPGSRIDQDNGVGMFYFVRLAALGVIGGRLRTNMAVGLDDRGSNPGPSTP